MTVILKKVLCMYLKMVKNTCLAKRAGEQEEEIDITELIISAYPFFFLSHTDMTFINHHVLFESG